jgi:hypothetical protein
MTFVRTGSAAALAVAAWVAVCGRGASVRAKEQGARLDHVTAEKRLGYLKRAQVWMTVPTASLDLLAGPDGDGAFPYRADVDCEYVDDQGRLNGQSPKFLCRRGDDVLKIRYGKDNGEVYAGIAASRLLWALGFGADTAYPVRVTCRRCPIDPWLWRTPQRVPQQVFDPAAVERRFAGTTIESREDEGWSWGELDLVDSAEGGAPRAHRDALVLLAVLLQHGDNQPGQQRLVCLPNGVERGPDGETCTRPFLIVHDLGATFGGAGRFSRNGSAKLNFSEWSVRPVFKDKATCVGNLRGARQGHLIDPPIREAGRRFLAERLAQLSLHQIHDLFVAAQVETRGGTLEEEGRSRPVTVEDWMQAFVRKRAEIATARCPS